MVSYASPAWLPRCLIPLVQSDSLPHPSCKCGVGVRMWGAPAHVCRLAAYLTLLACVGMHRERVLEVPNPDVLMDASFHVAGAGIHRHACWKTQSRTRLGTTASGSSTRCASSCSLVTNMSSSAFGVLGQSATGLHMPAVLLEGNSRVCASQVGMNLKPTERGYLG